MHITCSNTTTPLNNYALKTLTDTDINDYLSVTIEDQYGMLFDH